MTLVLLTRKYSRVIIYDGRAFITLANKRSLLPFKIKIAKPLHRS